MTSLGPLEFIKLGIYYASYLYFPAAALAAWFVVKGTMAQRTAFAVFLMLISCLAYARFVEPRILLVVEHDITINGCFEQSGAARIAVLSDTHNGLFQNAMPIERIVRKVEASNPDFVLIAGDFIYFLAPERFEETFGAFSQISSPVFAALGNHDIGLPGPDLSGQLHSVLPAAGMRLIDNQALRLSNSKFDIELVGLSDQWGREQKLSLLETPITTPRLVLTHNPATATDFRDGMSADLLIGGHTHGGQIQPPILTCLLTGVCGDIAYGLREQSGVQIFTTSGTGMVGLPMRFRVPPRIDVLNVGYKTCRAG